MPFDSDGFEFEPGGGDYRYHGMNMPFTQINSKVRDRGGIDWSGIRLNFGYGQNEQDENIEILDDYRRQETPWAWIYAGSLVGVLSLVWILRR
jgi:hypothetical protein